MKRQEIAKLLQDNIRQISGTYVKLHQSASHSLSSICDGAIDAMVKLGIAQNTEDAQSRMNAVIAGMESAEARLADDRDILAPELIRDSPLLDELFGGEASELFRTGQLAELRETLLAFTDEEGADDPEAIQRFAGQPKREQIRILGALYSKALEKTDTTGLREFDTIANNVDDMIHCIDERKELLYAICVANAMERHGVSMDTDEIYRSAGIYAHTAVSLINKTAQATQVDPVFSDRFITVGAVVLSITVSALFVAMISSVAIDLSAIEKAAKVLRDESLLDRLAVISKTQKIRRFSVLALPFVLFPAMRLLLERLNEYLTNNEQRHFISGLYLTAEEKAERTASELRFASMRYI